ncbi:MAG: hypothetical protein KatS3mg027_0520 [Bacteroidia bacterium]|nr:MAG: hypothetical protein KatS3mg027_0520 [Bacteroidia bacterium]
MLQNNFYNLFQIPSHFPTEIIVFSPYHTNTRLIHTLNFIFHRIWQKNYILTNNIDEFTLSDKLKINYSENHIEKCINVYPTPLITNYTKAPISPDFHITQNSFYPEDIFAKIFFFISRYEEWFFPFQSDDHQRFEKHCSVFKDELNRPLVDENIHNFKQFIQKLYPHFKTPYYFQTIYTFDLDNILAFKGKSQLRTTGALLKHLLKREHHLFSERIKTLFLNKEDPFIDVYHFIKQLSQKHPVIFFILCKSSTKFDRAANTQHPHTISTLQYLQSFAHIGLHPSYDSYLDEKKISNEKKHLENIIQTKILASRQHYLRMNISTTPKLLLKSGIQYDFTMGFASDTGWRAGTSYPFYYYDFETETSTNLLFIPFQVMDGAYFNYQKISIENSIQHLQNIYQTVQKFGGYFIPLFHEITLSPLFNKDAKQWRMFLQSI